MLSRTIVVVALLSVSLSPWSVSAACAQDVPDIRVLPARQEPIAIFASVAAASPVPAPAAQLGQFPVRIVRETLAPDGGRLGMLSLYASTVALQALDVHSTTTALNRGATEANPLMRGVTGNAALFYTTKAAVAASTIFVANRIAKRNKPAAMIFLAAVNSVYAGIVMHNYSVGHSLR